MQRVRRFILVSLISAGLVGSATVAFAMTPNVVVRPGGKVAGNGYAYYLKSAWQTILPLALVMLALIPSAASAHTSATCVLTGHTARCLGTVGNHTITFGDASGGMTLRSGYGKLHLTVAPMISFLTPPTTIAASLTCVTQAGEPTCVGMAKIERSKILITTVGRPGHGNVVIRLGDGVWREPVSND